MASDADKAQVMEMIKSLYRFANIPINFSGDVNESVASVFGIMLIETKKCSKAFGWVPIPPAGVASIGWLVIQFGRGVFNHSKGQTPLSAPSRSSQNLIARYKWRLATWLVQEFLQHGLDQKYFPGRGRHFLDRAIKPMRGQG
jgi:hypothetical protein